MKIDAHQHFWKYVPAEYPWIPPGSPLQRDWLPDDLVALHAPLDFAGSIAVQARQSVEESRWLLELADQHAHLRGVVGWVDLQAPDLARQLARFASHPRFVGVRHVVQDEPDDRFLLRAAFQRGLRLLPEFDLRYDLLLFPRQLPAAIELVRRFPDQEFVLDHCAKPDIKTGLISPWREEIRELALAPNVWCKVSGLVTEADHRGWRESDLTPYLDVVFEAFGAGRLMFGSDWPVCLQAGNYEKVLRVIERYAASLSPAETTALFGGNAARFYGIE